MHWLDYLYLIERQILLRSGLSKPLETAMFVVEPYLNSPRRHSHRILHIFGALQRKSLEVYKGSIAAPWDEISIALIQVVTHVMDDNYSEAYREQAHLVKFGHSASCS